MSIERVVPTGWSNSKLGDVVDIFDSKRVPVNAKERESRIGQVPYYGATGQVGWIDDYLFDDELVLLGEDGAPFLEAAKQKAYIIRGKSWVNNHAHVLKARSDIPSAYIKYYLDTVDYHEFVTGTTRLKLNQAAMRKIPVPLAPLEERTRIVAEIEKQFSRLDEAVANLKRVKANLKRYKAAVLKAAVEGKLTEDWRKHHPNVEPASKLLERILAERRAKWKGRGKYKEPVGSESNLITTLPQTWMSATAEQCTSVITDGEHITPQRSDSGVLLLSARNILDGRLSLSDVDYVQKTEYDRIAKRLVVNPNDVLLSCSGSVGRSTVSPEKLVFTLVRSVAVLKPLAEMGKYLSLALRSPILQEQISAKKTQTAQANIFQGKIKTLVIPLPPLTEQRYIVAEVERRLSVIDELAATVEANLTRADRLRQAILGQAFNGKLLSNGVRG